ncbi:35989_t:CDS:2, partial [Gigaspora margarita]
SNHQFENKKTALSGPLIFGLPLKILESERIRYQRSKILQPINQLSNSTQRIRANELVKPILTTFNNKSQIFWNIQFQQKNKKKEQLLPYIKAIDKGKINIDNIENENVVYGITELVGKAGYRNIKDILKYIIPTLIKNQVLDPLEPTIYIRISGDGRNVSCNIKHMMVTFAILNDLDTINQPAKHYTVILFSDIEKYDILQICTCQKSEIGLINKSWTIEKSMESINQNTKSYPGHNKKLLFNIIKLKNWVPDELHIFLRITDRLWDLAIQECKNDNRFTLYKAIKNPLTNPEDFKVDAQNWINLFLTPSSSKHNTNNFVKGLYNPVDITPYMHILVYHVAEFMKIHNQ